MTAKLRLYAATHGQAAREFAAALGREVARAAPRPPVPVVLEPAQAPPVSAVEEITTAQAQDLTGLSAERWRQLAGLTASAPAGLTTRCSCWTART